MKHRISRNPLGKTPTHRKAMISNLAISLFRHGSVETTHAKAKVAQSFIERIITRAKNDTVHNRRQVWRAVKDAAILDRIFTVIAPQYKERHGGYSRVTKRRRRRGDDAPMVILALLDQDNTAQESDSNQQNASKKERKSPA